jgi:hypothetical protein
MDWEGIIMGSLATIMGVVLISMRTDILEFAREGGRGLRDRRVINALVIVGTVFLLVAGIAVILTSIL